MAPITLNRAQFRQTKAAQKPGATYLKYLQYLAKHRSAPTPVDPFAPISQPVLQKQAGTYAHAQVDPLLKQLAAQINQQGAQGQANIAAATKHYQDVLNASIPEQQANYAQAQQSQSASDAAIMAALHGGGQQAADELTQKLGAIGAPNTAALAGQAAQLGQGAGAAAYATGSASLARLFAEGAHANEYALKQPGIAGAEGLQSSAALAAKLQQELASGSSDLTAKIPGLEQQFLSDAQNREFQKAVAKQGYGLDIKKLNQSASEYAQRIANEQARIRTQAQHNRATEKTAAQNATTAAARAKIAAHSVDIQNAKRVDGKTPKPNASLSAKYGHIVDQYGHAILDANGKKIPVAKTAAKPKPAGGTGGFPAKKP